MFWDSVDECRKNQRASKLELQILAATCLFNTISTNRRPLVIHRSSQRKERLHFFMGSASILLHYLSEMTAQITVEVSIE